MAFDKMSGTLSSHPYITRCIHQFNVTKVVSNTGFSIRGTDKGWAEPPAPFSSAYTTVMKGMPISKIWNSLDTTGLHSALYCKYVPRLPKRKGLA